MSHPPRPGAGKSAPSHSVPADTLALEMRILPWRTVCLTPSLAPLLRSSGFTRPRCPSCGQVRVSVVQDGAAKLGNNADHRRRIRHPRARSPLRPQAYPAGHPPDVPECEAEMFGRRPSGGWISIG